MAVKYLAGNRLTGSNSDRGGFTTTNLLSGSQWLETDTNDIYHWDGSSWDLVVGDTVSQTLTNKTLTSPTIGTSLIMGEDATIIFEGATANSNETTLTVVDPTGDRVVSLPNATDTLVGKATTDTFTNKTIVHASGGNSITGLVNASIAGSAGIVNSKLAGPAISVTDGSNSTNISHGSALTFAATANETTVANSSGTVTIGIVTNPTLTGNVSITGNLTVSGDTITANVGETLIEDSLISLATANSANSIDIGWYGKYVSSGTKYAGMFWDAGTGKFYPRTAMTSVPSSTWSGGSVATMVANIEGDVTGNVTGNTSGTSGSTTGNAATVTNGVYTTGTQTIGGVKTFSSDLITQNINIVADGYIAFGDTNHLIDVNAGYMVFKMPTNEDFYWQQGSTNIMHLDTSANLLLVGEHDTANGTINIAGGASGNDEGGELRLFTSADHDSTYDYYFFDAYQDDLRIGRAGIVDLQIEADGDISFNGHRDFRFGAGGAFNGIKYFDLHNQSTTATTDAIDLRLITRNTANNGTSAANIVKRYNGEFSVQNADTHANAYMRMYVGSTTTNGIHINSSGNVGINNASPDQKLTVAGHILLTSANDADSSNKYSIIAEEHYDTDDEEWVMMSGWSQAASHTLAFGGFDNAFNAATEMKFYTAANVTTRTGSERMVIKADGSVGIGETAPANLLHVKVSDTGIGPHGSAQIVLERDGTNYLQFLTGNDGTSGLLFGDEDDNDVSKIYYDHNTKSMHFAVETDIVMTIDGDVGDRRITLGDFGDEQTTEGLLYLNPNTHTVGANRPFHYMYLSNNNVITIPSGTASLVTGINIEIPNITNSGTITNTATVRIAGAMTEGNTDYALWVDAGDARFDGGVGIGDQLGARPSVPLHVKDDANGVARFESSDGTSSIQIMDNASNTSYPPSISTTGNVIKIIGGTSTSHSGGLAVAADGRVGIGTNAPASNLHVYEASNDTASIVTLTGDGETAGDVFARIGAQNLHHGTGTNGGEAFIDFRMASYQHSDRDGADILMQVADSVGVMAPALAIESPSTAGSGTTTKTTVFGTLKIKGGSPGADKVLTSDADGDATWEDASSGGASVGTAIAMALVF